MALSFSVLLSIAIATVSLARGQTFRRVARTSDPAQTYYLLAYFGDDLVPMARAYSRKIADPGSDLYATFFVDRVKFQYPPSSLLIFDFFPRVIRPTDGVVSQPLRRWLAWRSGATVALTVLLSGVILEVGLRRLTPVEPVQLARVAARLLLSLALGASFYPLLFAHFVGQVQVVLNGLLALALLFYLIGWRAAAGMCLGVCCLVKPQYGLILVWSLLRRQWQFTLGLAGIFFAGLAISVSRFGIADHLRYLEVARELSRGEAFWLNQSINGLLNRLLGNGSPIRWSHTDFAPYHPVVFALTMISSGAILALALWPRRGSQRGDGGLVDLMVMLVATTMASPIAWNHHYGAFLAIFAAAVPGLVYVRPFGRATTPLFAVSYVAVANFLERSPAIFRNPWLGLVGSHLLFGSLVFFGLLLALRGTGWDGRSQR